MVNLISRALHAQTQHADQHSEVNPQFLLRVAGLPIDVMDRLHFEQSMQWIDQTLALESWLIQQKEAVSDHLHQLVNTYKDNQQMRRKLINTKRMIFNMRLPNNTTELHTLASALTAEEQAPLSRWLEVWERYQQVQAQGSAIFAQELQQKRCTLKEIISLPDFRKGVMLASPSLDQAVDSYLKSDNLKPHRDARTAERSLLEYLFRTTCKTSPFSTLTSVCTGVVQEEVSQDIACEIASMEKASFTRLNLAVLSRLMQPILDADDIRDELAVRVTSGWRLRYGRVRYLRRRSNIDDIPADSPIAIDILHENVLTLPAGPLLRTLLNFMGDGRVITLGEVKAHLTSHPKIQEAKKEVEEYLQQLLRLRFLIVPALQLDIHSQNPLRTFYEGLKSIGKPLTDTLAEHLQAVEALVGLYATASVQQRHEIIEAIKSHILACHAALGSVDPILPRTILYEDTTIRPRHLAVSQQRWQEIFSNLAELQSLLPVFDFNVSRKLITKGYFRARYGMGQRCDDFLAFADTFNQDFFEQHQKDAASKETLDSEGKFTRRQNTFRLPEIDILDTARQEIADYISRCYARQQPGVGGALQLGQDFLDTIAPYVPEQVKDIQSHAFFSQFAQVGSEPHLIINRVYTGLTLMFSRFAHCFAEEEGYQVVAELRKRLEALQPPGTVFAELKGGYDATNLNLHPVVTPYELVCPGELSTRPLDEQISLDDLYIQDDLEADTLRLYSRRLGKEVIPVYLGFLIPMMLPEIQQILLNFAHMSMCPLELWIGVAGPQGHPDEVIAYPRLLYKQLILQRAMWKVPMSRFPHREAGQSDVDFFLQLNRWRKQHGIPSKVFLKPDKTPTLNDRGEVEDGFVTTSHSRKPLYVDFENFFALTVLEGVTKQLTGRIQLTEMLPHRESLWLQHNGQSYVSELIFEMNSVSGGSYADR